MRTVKIKSGNIERIIHGEKEKLESGQIVNEINTIDSFTFTILPGNAGFDLINEFTTFVEVYNTRKKKYDFIGRVLHPEDEMSEDGLISTNVVCESVFGYLCDSQQTYVETRNWTVTGLLQHLIDCHNSQVEEYKRFTVGNVTVTDKNDNLYVGISRENTWDSIKSNLIDKLGGELQYRVVDDVIYIDYLEKIGETKTTEIALSVNMKSIVRTKDPTAFITRLIPLGSKLSDDTEDRVDITSVNGGLNYIDDVDAIDVYGIHVGYVEFDDISSPSLLLTRGKDWLAENNKVQIKYSITALDLSSLGLSIDDFEIYNYYPIKNSLLGVDDFARIIKQTIDVCDETSSTIEVGDNLKTLSDIDYDERKAYFEALKKTTNELKSNVNAVQTVANNAQNTAIQAKNDAATAQTAADTAAAAASDAQKSAQDAQSAANTAQAAVDIVEETVSELETTAANAEAAAEQAKQSAASAETKATEAHTAATNAANVAETAKSEAETAKTAAETANSTANTAKTTAQDAKTVADAASEKAAAAKLDAENAQKEIDALGDDLMTLSNTMSVDYARKTDLTEARASLQTQITQNAQEISSHAKSIVAIDETANNASEIAQQAQTVANSAQETATQAKSDAEAAQTAADTAAAAASDAQTEADNAAKAAADAKSAADQAASDLATAERNLADVTSRVGVTEEEIAAAQEAVETAQSAADTAKANAATAQKAANNAKTAADNAQTAADNAKTTADTASAIASAAQSAADAAQNDATAAQNKANEAAQTAATAQQTANTAKTNAANAQTKADEAALAAANAQKVADDADAKAAQAAADLAVAEKNLADVTSRVGVTEEEIAAAQEAVETAQSAADTAKANAATAQSTADTAKANAATAQKAANNAKTAADNAQTAADNAKTAADAAQADVDALAARVTEAETSITQNSEEIELRAKKTEVAQTLSGYYTKEQADAAIQVKANEITSSVSSSYATKSALSETDTKAANAATAAANAQSTADTAKANAATAQQTADTAKTNAATAQTKANEAAAAAASAVKSTERYYLLQDATAEPPTAPVTTEDLGSWTTTEPTDVDTTKSLYYCDAITHVSGETSYTDVYKSGSYEMDSAAATAQVDVEQALSEKIVASETNAIQSAETIILSALESYTQTGDFESFKESVEAQLAILANEIVMNFTTTSEQISSVDGSLQTKFNEVYKHISFSEYGITISAGDNNLSLVLDNDKISFQKNGMEFGHWDGQNFYTGNIVVSVEEKAQFGNFAFVPRSDGSLQFLKVGG